MSMDVPERGSPDTIVIGGAVSDLKSFLNNPFISFATRYKFVVIKKQQTA
jgi:hypothetical protein